MTFLILPIIDSRRLPVGKLMYLVFQRNNRVALKGVSVPFARYTKNTEYTRI